MRRAARGACHCVLYSFNYPFTYICPAAYKSNSLRSKPIVTFTDAIQWAFSYLCFGRDDWRVSACLCAAIFIRWWYVIFVIRIIHIVIQLWRLDRSISSAVSDAIDGEGNTFVNQYSKKYKKVTDEDLANIQSKNLLQTGDYTVQFVRHPDDAYGTVNLRIESPMNIQGCGSADFPRVDVKRQGKTINISMSAPEVIPGADVRYPHYECNITEATPRIDIPLSRNEMLAYGIERVKISVGTVFDQFTVEFGKDNIVLTPVSSNTIRPADRANALNHVFYPVNMVILRCPAGVKDKHLAEKWMRLRKSISLLRLKNQSQTPNNISSMRWIKNTKS